MGGELIRSVGIGNLNRVLAHGEELGVRRMKPEESGEPRNEGVRYEIPADPPVPGKRIYDDAIMRFEQSRRDVPEENRIAERRQLANETAERFLKGGLDAFVDDLAKGLGVKGDDRLSRRALTRIAEQLFASKAVTWWARNVANRDAKAVIGVDMAVGRDITLDKLMDAAATLSVMVRRGELSLEHVETYLNETVYDYADKKTMVQMTARAMGQMRANVLEFGWGQRYADLAKSFREAVKNAEPGKAEKLLSKFADVIRKANAIREARKGLIRELGLDGVMIRPDDDADTVLSAFRQRLKRAGNALELSRSFFGVPGALDGDRNFAGAEVRAFHDAAKELEALLRGDEQKAVPEGWTLVDKEPDTGFTPEFRNSVADGVKLLGQGLELTARLEREEAIRAAFKEAITGIETGENGLCKPGVYQLSISVSVGASAGLGVEDTKASAKMKLGAQVTVIIGEDGSASVAHGFSVGLEVGAEVKIPAVKVKGGVDVSAAVKNSTNYKNIDDMCNGMSRAILAIATGKELGNIFHAGSANAKSMELSRSLDNYAMRAHLGNLGLLDDTDRYLTPLRNDKVVGETKSGTFKAGYKLSASAGSDEDTFLKKSGFNASLAADASATLSTTVRYRTFFDVARDERKSVVWPTADCSKYEKYLYDPTHSSSRKELLLSRIAQLRAELEDFTRAAAAQSGGGRFKSARPDFSYREHLARRGIELKGWNAFRNIFQGNIRRTLFLADLAKEAAYCESELRGLLAKESGGASGRANLPEVVEHTIRMIEEGIYGRCGVQLNSAVAKNCLYATEEKQRVAMSTGFSADAGFSVPHTATAPGLSAAVTLGYSFDPENPDLEPRPWDTRNSASIAIGFTDMPGADVIVDLVMSKLDVIPAMKDVLVVEYRELVAKQVNDFLKKHAKDWVPPSGLLSDKIAHTLTVNIIRTGTGLRLGDISFSRSHQQSIGANTPDFGVSVGLSLSRRSERVLSYGIGTNTLNSLMSRFEKFGKNPVQWESLLKRHGGNVEKLMKNMSAPPDAVPPETPRKGVAGELDMILAQMVRNGNRKSLDDFLAAWNKVRTAVDGGDAKARGTALTELLQTVSDFYADEDWRTEHALPAKSPEPPKPEKQEEIKSFDYRLDGLQRVGWKLVDPLEEFGLLPEGSAESNGVVQVNAVQEEVVLDNVAQDNARLVSKVTGLLEDKTRFADLKAGEKDYLLGCLQAHRERFIEDLESAHWNKVSFFNGDDDQLSVIETVLKEYLRLYNNIPRGFSGDGNFHIGNGGPATADGVMLNGVWGQGKNTCFMMSMLNGMVQTQKGVEHLKRHFVGDKFKVSLPKKAGSGGNAPFEREVDLSGKNGVRPAEGFSMFEEKLHGVYMDYLSEQHQDDVPGQGLGHQGIAPRFAEVIGLVPDGTEPLFEYNGDGKAKEFMAKRVAGVVNEALRSGKVCVLFEGVNGGGHYMTVTGVRIGEDGQAKFRLVDSAGYDESQGGRIVTTREVNVADYLGKGANNIDILSIP